MKKYINYKLFILFLLPIIISYPQSKSEKLNDLLSRYQEYGLFNGSVLVAEQGEVIFKKGYGFADMEFDIANQPNTVHRIGSITKQFVATMIMQLVEAGKVKVDEKMTTYLKDYRKDTGDRVTVYNLLNHTSGIPSYTGYPGFWSDSTRNPYTTDELIKNFCSGDLEFEPGSKYLYNNSGYVLLAKLIEDVTGKSFEENIQERIFDKVGMKNSYLDRPEKIIKNRAAGYDKRGIQYQNTKYFNVKNAIGAGDIVSTVEDLFLWDQALYTDKIISEKSKKEMFTPYLNNYGYGWGIVKSEHPAGGDSLNIYRHSGGINGFNALLLRIIDDQHFIVMLNNTGRTPLNNIAKEIENILYGQDYEFPKKPIDSYLHELILEEGIEEAVKIFNEIKETEEEIFDINENQLNNLGYLFLGEEKIDEAIAIFKLNVKTYPDSWNVYDSMAEALMEKGENEKSIELYKKSIEMNPQNKGAYEKLKILGIEISPPKDAEVSKEVLKSYVGIYN
ncbi:MAG: serine hydrolase, partial [Ignavibacteriae bacterium]|nr:serine hydrolase [Ignavibacteriota bacterium]